ncbi:MAG: TraB/VirB10 family protein [Chlamydiales bacterium]
MSNPTQKKQNRLLVLLLIGFFIGFGGLSYYFVRDDFSPRQEKTATILPMDKASPQELWLSRLEAEKQVTDQRLKYLEDLLLENKKNEGAKDIENHYLKQEVAKFKQDLIKVAESSLTKKPREEVAQASDPFRYANNIPQIPPPSRPLLAELIIEDATPERLQHVDKVIPAGTSVRALLVSSVDMPCGISNHSDPQPIKLRLIDDGHLPKGVRAQLKGGIIIASAYGDLSNERIYIRIERLTQVRGDGKFIETGVTGYVTGEDGKYGIRGIVVDKSYKMVENAAISGLFSGVNQYLQASASKGTNIYEPGYNINGRDLALQGGYQGANSAFDMLADYYIKRAEQVRPVIQATAGRILDVTFTCNAELGDLHTKEKIKYIREISRGRT